MIIDAQFLSVLREKKQEKMASSAKIEKNKTFNSICPVMVELNFPNLKHFHWVSIQGLHRLEKYFNLEAFLEKSLKIKSALKSTGKLLKSLEKTLNSTIFCRTKHCW